MTEDLHENDPVDAVALAWLRERPGTPVDGIGIVTRLWQCAKLLGEDRRRLLADAAVDAATLDLLSVLRRSGPPYRLTTRQLTDRTLVSAGAISQRVARAERDGLVIRASPRPGSRAVAVSLTPAGHDLVERLVDRVLGREADLISGLSLHQQATLTHLLRLLLDDLNTRLGPQRPTQVGSS
ncbi:MarR family transcriptional regulator [Micromonospora echinospora]|uniref:DNA-binding transcriptional regulator, MarR family n=1 Tax=Micromonospora echinospora TaxID=1877 RepID=A0A1C4YUV0_MICEC|nr:MarR family transcriptional regulator [Micromonospora echinospora]OZV74599.1 MarR family transcriptional regulator [Micromonospora echinospora]SCF24417.1 DNA-binding transcriptional regulator, MarR family [Micromonospora echinospora]